MLTFLLKVISETIVLIIGNRLLFTYICGEADYVVIVITCLIAAISFNLKLKKKWPYVLIFILCLAAVIYYTNTIFDNSLKLTALFIMIVYTLLCTFVLGTSKWLGCLLLLLPMFCAIYYSFIYIGQFVLLAASSLLLYLFNSSFDDGVFVFKRFAVIIIVALISILSIIPLSKYVDPNINPIKLILEKTVNGKKFDFRVSSYEEKEAKVYCNFHFSLLRKTSYGKYDKGKLYNNMNSSFFNDINFLDFAYIDENMYSYKIVTTSPDVKVLTPYGLLRRDDTFTGIRDESYQFINKLPQKYSIGFTPYAKIAFDESLNQKYLQYIEYVKQEYAEVPEYMQYILKEYFFEKYGIDLNNSSAFDLVQNIYETLNDNFILYEENRNVSDYKDRVEIFLTNTQYGDYKDFNMAFMLILRYCGIPCRMAEGYILNNWNNNVASYNTDEIRTWIEIYASNYGWIPVDVAFGQPKWMLPESGIDIEELFKEIDIEELIIVFQQRVRK